MTEGLLSPDRIRSQLCFQVSLCHFFPMEVGEEELTGLQMMGDIRPLHPQLSRPASAFQLYRGTMFHP